MQQLILPASVFHGKSMSRSGFRDQFMELLPHYLGMILIMILVLTAVNIAAGPVGTWPAVGIALAVAIAYPFAVRWSGHAPEAWQ